VKALSITVTNGQPPATLTVDRPQVTTTFRIGHFATPSETVQVTSSGTATVPLTVQSGTASGGAWLSVSPPSGVTPASLTLSFSPTSLPPGVYTGTVTVTPATGTPLNIAVTLS